MLFLINDNWPVKYFKGTTIRKIKKDSTLKTSSLLVYPNKCATDDDVFHVITFRILVNRGAHEVFHWFFILQTHTT